MGEDVKDKVLEFIRLANEAKAIVERAQSSSKDIWSETYDYVFGQIGKGIKATKITVEYYDPDTSYQEDVEAYVDALNEKAESLALMAGSD